MLYVQETAYDVRTRGKNPMALESCTSVRRSLAALASQAMHRCCILAVTMRLSSCTHGDCFAESARLDCCVISCSLSSEWLIGTLVQPSFSFSLYSQLTSGPSPWRLR